jgi:hypothetical protein
MKKTFLIFMLTLIATAVFAQVKTPKAEKVLDPSVPFEQNAVLYFPKDSVVLMFDDIKCGVKGK